jgi:superoxide dismutase, Fe-Mn family
MPDKLYSLPELPYGYGELTPYISEEQLTVHHQKHHAAYVKGANAVFEKLEKAREENADLDMKAVLKELSFHIGGHVLHSLFWQNMAPAGDGGGGEPEGELARLINGEFGSFERFKKEFTQAVTSIEGSGWAVLSLDGKTGRPVIMQIEKHNLNMYPNFRILTVLDFWEHAYYIDYKNEKAKFVEAFWNIINWKEAASRLQG